MTKDHDDPAAYQHNLHAAVGNYLFRFEVARRQLLDLCKCILFPPTHEAKGEYSAVNTPLGSALDNFAINCYLRSSTRFLLAFDFAEPGNLIKSAGALFSDFWIDTSRVDNRDQKAVIDSFDKAITSFGKLTELRNLLAHGHWVFPELDYPEEFGGAPLGTADVSIAFRRKLKSIDLETRSVEENFGAGNYLGAKSERLTVDAIQKSTDELDSVISVFAETGNEVTTRWIEILS